MPTLREKILEVSTATPPATIRQHLSSASATEVVIGGKDTLEVQQETLTMNLVTPGGS